MPLLPVVSVVVVVLDGAPVFAVLFNSLGIVDGFGSLFAMGASLGVVSFIELDFSVAVLLRGEKKVHFPSHPDSDTIIAKAAAIENAFVLFIM